MNKAIMKKHIDMGWTIEARLMGDDRAMARLVAPGGYAWPMRVIDPDDALALHFESPESVELR